MTDLPGHPFMLPPSAAAGIMALSRSPSVHAGDAGEVHMTLRYPDDSEDDDAVDPMDNRESAASISISASTQASTISVDTPSARRTSQRLSGRSSHKYGAGKSERRGRKPKFARDQRATIRAMDQRGYSIGDIKVAFPASDLTIKSIITNSGRRDDLSEDQSYVDAEIMQKYPAKNGSSSSACRASQIVPSKRRQEDTTTSESLGAVDDAACVSISKAPRTPLSAPHDPSHAAKRSRLSQSTAPNLNQTIVPAPVPGAYAEAFDLRAMSKQPITTGKSCVAGLEAHASRDTNPPADSVGQITGAGTASTIQGSHHPTTASASMLAGTTQNASSSTTIPSAKTLKVDFAAAFLANLDVDLSAHHDALVKCYLGTAQDVKSRRDWPIEWFRIILDREVPGASVFERFVLARAFKLIKDDGSMEKSLMRTRLDEAPQVWTTSSAGFFEGLALDLSPVFPDFHSAGLGLLGPILAMAGWSEDTRRALFDEALPNLKAIHRFVFERELKGIGAAAQSSPTIIQELVAAVQARHLTGHKTDATTRPLPPTFLANLDHDLLYIAGGLSTCGIATVEDVVSLRSWHAEDLHNMLRQVLPKLVPVERHVLVRGIKNSLGLEMGEHSKSALRYKLDAHPDLGKRTIVEFLSASPYDLAKFAPRLEGAGLSTLESVLVLAEWDVRDLLALLDEALPGVSTTISFSIIACLKRDAEVLTDLAG